MARTCLGVEAMTMSQALHSVLTDEEYDRAKADFVATYGENNKEAAALRDQAMAKLFARSGWTQEKLAAKELKPQNWVSRHLKFGHFLSFIPMGINSENLPKNLSERRFRSFWEQTDKNEPNDRIRFQAVLKMVQDNTRISNSTAPKGHTNAIREKFADAEWHPVSHIAEDIGTDDAAVERALVGMNKLGSVKVEKRLRGRDQHVEYRIFPRDKTVSSKELAEKLGPLIKELKLEGKKNMVTMAPPVVARIADLLQRLLDEWTA